MHRRAGRGLRGRRRRRARRFRPAGRADGEDGDAVDDLLAVGVFGDAEAGADDVVHFGGDDLPAGVGVGTAVDMADPGGDENLGAFGGVIVDDDAGQSAIGAPDAADEVAGRVGVRAGEDGVLVRGARIGVGVDADGQVGAVAALPGSGAADAEVGDRAVDDVVPAAVMRGGAGVRGGGPRPVRFRSRGARVDAADGEAGASDAGDELAGDGGAQADADRFFGAGLEDLVGVGGQRGADCGDAAGFNGGVGVVAERGDGDERAGPAGAEGGMVDAGRGGHDHAAGGAGGAEGRAGDRLQIHVPCGPGQEGGQIVPAVSLGQRPIGLIGEHHQVHPETALAPEIARVVPIDPDGVGSAEFIAVGDRRAVACIDDAEAVADGVAVGDRERAGRDGDLGDGVGDGVVGGDVGAVAEGEGLGEDSGVQAPGDGDFGLGGACAAGERGAAGRAGDMAGGGRGDRGGAGAGGGVRGG